MGEIGLDLIDNIVCVWLRIVVYDYVVYWFLCYWLWGGFSGGVSGDSCVVFDVIGCCGVFVWMYGFGGIVVEGVVCVELGMWM